jgi:predicted dehydrogenase
MKIAGINFDHMHMGDLLRMVHEHPYSELVGICDEQPERMQMSIDNFGLPPEKVFTDYRECLEKTKPDIVILCPATAEHADWTEKVAPFGVHILMEKPFAASLADADRMIAAMEKSGKQLAINWPLRWLPGNYTAHKLIEEGRIGKVTEVSHYGGNRGPLYHTADKVETNPTTEEKAASWWYSKERGGGSLLDYLGYGTTLGTWYHGSNKPLEVQCMTDIPQGLEVDEHSITMIRYDVGLSKFETRWGTFTDPWIIQPQPTCGFIIKGTDGTIACPDYAETLRIQDRERPGGYDEPVRELDFKNPIEYFTHCIHNNEKITGPLSLEVARMGQLLVDAAYKSAETKEIIKL